MLPNGKGSPRVATAVDTTRTVSLACSVVGAAFREGVGWCGRGRNAAGVWAAAVWPHGGHATPVKGVGGLVRLMQLNRAVSTHLLIFLGTVGLLELEWAWLGCLGWVAAAGRTVSFRNGATAIVGSVAAATSTVTRRDARSDMPRVWTGGRGPPSTCQVGRRLHRRRNI